MQVEPLRTDTEEDKKIDVSLYKERGNTYRIIGNRLMQRAIETDRKYINKNVRVLNESFDPLRIRLRVMPISRAPLVQGKNSDFYFIEAGKLGLRGDLTHAIDMLKRGLELKPDHLLCRFNHGVIMFKFGLIYEAAQDFYRLTQTDKIEAWVYFNYAICLVQLGLPSKPKKTRRNSAQTKKNAADNQFDAVRTSTDYQTSEGQSKFLQGAATSSIYGSSSKIGVTAFMAQERGVSKTHQEGTQNYEDAISACDSAIKHGKNDKLLLIDTYMLKAVALYRLSKPLEAVRMFNIAKRIKKNMDRPKMSGGLKQSIQ